MKSLVIAAVLTLATPLSYAASFDCQKASSSVEKAICSNPTLGKLDEALAENYRYMMASNIGDGARKDLRQTQRAWVAKRNKCADGACIEAAYRSRVDDVCDYPVISGIHPNCTSSDEIK
ncbi:lysozyme inhibitor LprI family protein [Rivihabitans pingtungensis]|jgi:uncharacterized protein|uniref:lysozyme inhibitor LprI family protein n=1 Tax=Rivihabitans pingtungensis TaxID=1054498 RepID=UPI002FDB8BB6